MASQYYRGHIALELNATQYFNNMLHLSSDVYKMFLSVIYLGAVEDYNDIEYKKILILFESHRKDKEDSIRASRVVLETFEILLDIKITDINNNSLINTILPKYFGLVLSTDNKEKFKEQLSYDNIEYTDTLIDIYFERCKLAKLQFINLGVTEDMMRSMYDTYLMDVLITKTDTQDFVLSLIGGNYWEW